MFSIRLELSAILSSCHKKSGPPHPKPALGSLTEHGPVVKSQMNAWKSTYFGQTASLFKKSRSKLSLTKVLIPNLKTSAEFKISRKLDEKEMWRVARKETVPCNFDFLLFILCGSSLFRALALRHLPIVKLLRLLQECTASSL
jgi:hypothetical protein